MRLSLDTVESELTRLWEDEARKSHAVRVELMTVVALVSDTVLRDAAAEGLAAVVAAHPARTILAVARSGDEASITAEVALHRTAPDAPARGDALVLEAIGAGREWFPENIDRFALPDLPVCLWWVGDLPDFDRLFDRMLCCADVVVVNSDEMDLRDLERLAEIAMHSRNRYALSDLSWTRLHPLQELIARFFDDERARASLSSLSRIRIDFVPRSQDPDATCTQAGLLFGWMMHALGAHPEAAQWKRGETWSEATVGKVVVRFEQRERPLLPPGTVAAVVFECGDATFTVERQEDDPHVLRWSREIPGAPSPQQALRMPIVGDSSLLVKCLDRPKRDPLLERSLRAASIALRPVAPQLVAKS